jgi:microcystin-dependent protein
MGPLGELKIWASVMGEPPESYLLCDGRVLPRSQYVELSNLIEDKFAPADDPSPLGYFRLPNASNMMIRFQEVLP